MLALRLFTCFLQLLAGLALPAVHPQVRTCPIPGLAPLIFPSQHWKQGTLKLKTHSMEQDLLGCPHISQGPGWTSVLWEEISGWAVPSSRGLSWWGQGSHREEGGFLSGPWSPSGFAKSICPLIPCSSLALWSGSRPGDQPGTPRTSDLAWWGGSWLKRLLVGRIGPAPTRAQG